MRQNASQTKAMTEVALALSMGFLASWFWQWYQWGVFQVNIP